MHSNPAAPLSLTADAIFLQSVRPKLAPAQDEVNRRQVVRKVSGFVDKLIGIPELEVEKRKYRRQRQQKVQQQPPASTHQQQHQLLSSQQQVLHPQLTEKEKATSVKLAQRNVPLQRHLNKDKNKEREKEKERNKTKDKDKVMAERHSNAQERRIHELDHNVERFFEVRKVSVDCWYFFIFFFIDWLIDRFQIR